MLTMIANRSVAASDRGKVPCPSSTGFMVAMAKLKAGNSYVVLPTVMVRSCRPSRNALCDLSGMRLISSSRMTSADASGPKHIQKSLTRAKLEQLTDKLFERTIGPVKACLKDAGIEASKQAYENSQYVVIAFALGSIILALGLAAVLGFSSFATFNAETDNPNNIFSDGSLTRIIVH